MNLKAFYCPYFMFRLGKCCVCDLHLFHMCIIDGEVPRWSAQWGRDAVRVYRTNAIIALSMLLFVVWAWGLSASPLHWAELCWLACSQISRARLLQLIWFICIHLLVVNIKQNIFVYVRLSSATACMMNDEQRSTNMIIKVCWLMSLSLRCSDVKPGFIVIHVM